MKVGKQGDGTWVLSSNVHITSTGHVVAIDDSCYIWIGHIFNGPGVASHAEECSIEHPLTTDPLCALMESLQAHFSHNFVPCVMAIASAIFVLHYQLFLSKLKLCPVPLLFGDSGTGKTTALLCGLALYGAHDTRFYSKITKEKVLQLCVSSGLPVGVDDPQSRSQISRLIIDLFNGARTGSITHGDQKPSSTCIVSANFTTLEQQRYRKLPIHVSAIVNVFTCRYSSRCLMIEFLSPPLSFSLTELAELWEGCTSCAGFAVSLGKRFFSSGIQEVDTEILPKLSSAAAVGVIPRVLPSYSILYWFSKQVCVILHMY